MMHGAVCDTIDDVIMPQATRPRIARAGEDGGNAGPQAR
jgi:hypothetical protein